MNNEQIPQFLSRSLSKKARLSICDFKLSIKNQMQQKSSSHHRRSQPNLVYNKKGLQNQNIKQDNEDRFPTINKFQTLTISFQQDKNEQKKAQKKKIKYNTISKKNSSKQSKLKFTDQKDNQIKKNPNQKLFFIRNVDLVDVQAQNKKQIIHKILSKIKDVDRKKKNNLQNLFKKVSNYPQQLKTLPLKYNQIKKQQKVKVKSQEKLFLAPKIKQNKIIKQQNVTGWNIRQSNDTLQNFYTFK